MNKPQLKTRDQRAPPPQSMQRTLDTGAPGAAVARNRERHRLLGAGSGKGGGRARAGGFFSPRPQKRTHVEIRGRTGTSTRLP